MPNGLVGQFEKHFRMRGQKLTSQTAAIAAVKENISQNWTGALRRWMRQLWNHTQPLRRDIPK
jgi:ATP-dependent protease Clp ATPase subunit